MDTKQDAESDLLTNEVKLEKGRLYKYDGHELVIVEPGDVLKVPITEEAMEALKEVRKAAVLLMRGRPELMVVSSAMLLAAANLPDIAVLVKQYGKRFYGD